MPAYLGQHFLIDEAIAQRAVEALDIGPEDLVIEIGPGRGILTRHVLHAQPKRLIAVELDQDLIGTLRAEFKYTDRFEIIHSDFLKLNLDTAIGPSSPADAGTSPVGGRKSTPLPTGEDARRAGEGLSSVKFIGNLPYAVASPILQKVLAWERTSLAVFMFQKEVCDRLAAEPGNRDYGVLSVVAQLHAQVSWVAVAGKDRFRPRPQVDSGVLQFKIRPTALPKGVTEQRLMTVVKTAFSQRRKQIANPLSHGLGLPKEQVLKALEACGIPPEARAEEVPVERFAALTKVLVPPKKRSQT